MAFLELRDLRYSYGKTEVLHGVSCLFELGGVYAVIGKSGSGKTTLLSLLAGLDAPASGDILFEGESIGKKDLLTYRREKVSVVYQNFRLFPLMTALENVMYPLELRGVKPKEAAQRGAAYMESVGLD
ncbi:MAG: ATP-binding cassette domain-containing protein, partial [Oscillospiraceae bacterium]|nr:ATP-binding cassette domain-containing protein [Oscillospiraceae bacterium]